MTTQQEPTVTREGDAAGSRKEAGLGRVRPAERPARDPGRLTSRRRLSSIMAATPYVAPLVLAVVAVIIGPAFYAISQSFFNWQPGGSSPFVGLANYTSLAQSASFREILVNEGIYLLGLPFWTFLPPIIAVFLFTKVRIAGAVRTLIFLPAIVSPALLGVMFTPILSPTGLIDTTLAKVGLGRLAQPWTESPGLVKPTIIAVLVWANVGLGVAIFTAALTGIKPELIDAAHVEGASSLQRFRYVILPSLYRTVILWATYQALGVFLWLFGLIYALTGGGPGNSSTSIDYDIFNNTITNGLFGLGAAESVYLLIMVGLLAVFGWRLGRRWSHE